MAEMVGIILVGLGRLQGPFNLRIHRLPLTIRILTLRVRSVIVGSLMRPVRNANVSDRRAFASKFQSGYAALLVQIL